MKTKTRPLSEAQALVIRDLRRTKKTPGGLVPYRNIQHFDGRTMSALLQRGLIQYKENGLAIIDNGDTTP